MGKLKTTHESKLQWLRIGDLTTEPTAQRPYDERWAKDIASKFDPDGFGIPCVGVIPGPGGRERKVVIDGQHRCKAAAIVLGDDQLIQCEVMYGTSVEEVAKRFLLRNRSKAIRVIDKFLAGVTAKNPIEVAITKIIEEVGVRVGKGPNHVAAVASLTAVYKLDQGAALARTLRVVTKAWGKGEDVFNGDLLRGLGSALARYDGEIDDATLVKKLAQHPGGAGGVVGRGRTVRTVDGGPVWRGTAEAIVKLYNTSKRNRLPRWDEAGKKA